MDYVPYFLIFSADNDLRIGGDSGSLIVNSSQVVACLLFASIMFGSTPHLLAIPLDCLRFRLFLQVESLQEAFTSGTLEVFVPGFCEDIQVGARFSVASVSSPHHHVTDIHITDIWRDKT